MKIMTISLTQFIIFPQNFTRINQIKFKKTDIINLYFKKKKSNYMY